MTKKHVALLVGGMSSEREVSLISGKGVEKSLTKLGFKVTFIDVDQDVASKLKAANPDVAFNALHGTYGEDGCISGLLEIMGIPYTHSGVEASAIAMNKETTKKLLKDSGIKFAKSQCLTPKQIRNGEISIDFPFVLKPSSEGSSVGIYVVKTKNDMPELSEIEKFNHIMIEEYIDGADLFCATLDEGSLGVIEVKPKTGFYNYENKYTDGMADHIMPANINEKTYQDVMDFSFIAHKKLGCSGLSRSDFRYDPKKDTVYFLELNTHPGFTPLSLVPEIAAFKGISYDDLVLKLINSASCKNKPYISSTQKTTARA